MTQHHDVVVLGSGAAGLSLVLRLLELAPDMKIALVSKDQAISGSTALAQGGIAAAIDADDSPAAHGADTETAGAGLCHPETVRFVAEQAPGAINWLAGQGVAFDRRDDDGFALTLEGGHAHRRIVHAGDATGRAVSLALVERLQRHQVTWLERRIAIDLVIAGQDGMPPQNTGRGRCTGVNLLNQATGEIEQLLAPAIVLATGGASGIYLHCTNPAGATGDGIAMAWRAGCRVANLEFTQFHPTCLYQPAGGAFLISEALRGEGARLLTPQGAPLMQGIDPRGDLAPRDIVARAINAVMVQDETAHVWLDISHRPADFLYQRFPSISAYCRSIGIDIARQPIPVVPAAHYSCGGVATDLQGRSDIDGLYALGETAWTGLHGANRLASNSLLECVVFALAAAQDIVARSSDGAAMPVAGWPIAGAKAHTVDADRLASLRQDIRRCLWDAAGIRRSPEGLAAALQSVSQWRQEIEAVSCVARLSADLIELRNMALVAELTIRSALSRRESRGAHAWMHETVPDAPRDTILAA